MASMLAAVAAAATPRDELLRLVPENMGFCLALDDLRGHGTAFAESPFIQQFRTSALGTKIRSAPETQKLTELDPFLQQISGLTASQLRDDILGDALVVAYRPGPPDKPEEEDGVFLLRARDAQLLARLIERINTLQKESGDLEDVKERTYHGSRYYRRVERATSNYYYVHGPVLAFAPREGILRQVIDRDRESPKDAESFVARQFRLLGVHHCLAALWINPRAFDAALQQETTAAAGAHAAALRTLVTYWKRLEGIALSVSLEKDLALTLAVRAKLGELPPAAQRFFRTASEASALWQRFPDGALLAVAGRVDVPALVEMLGEFLADDARKSFRTVFENTIEAILGKDTIQELLPNLGPDCGLCVLAPPSGSKSWVPHILGALRVNPGTANVAVDRAVWYALNALAALAVFHHNHGQPGQLILKSTVQDKTEVNYLVNEEQFPPGLQPAFALKGGYLILASAPEAIRRFPAVPSETSATDPARVPLLKLSLRGWCVYLRDQREPLLAYTAAKNQLSREEAGRQLDNLLMVLQLFDRVELTQHTSPGLLTLTLRVQMVKPLK
jgi:hypothetical protein